LWPPAWIRAVVDIAGPLSILAIFASIFTWSRRQRATRGWDSFMCFAQALIGAAIWGAVGFFVVLWIALDKSGCLS
jgi:predicted Na+-dependent transporter